MIHYRIYSYTLDFHKQVLTGLNSSETERLVELDDILESYLSADQKTPSEIKVEALNKFDRLMESTDKLIEEIESQLRGDTPDVED